VAGDTLNGVQIVRMIQLATAGAGLWALSWLLSRRRLQAWRETPDSPHARPLMLGQLAIALTGCWLLVTAAVGGLVFRPEAAGLDGEGAAYAAAPGWVLEAGSALGWLGLLLTAAAVVLRSRRPLPVLVVDWGGLAAG